MGPPEDASGVLPQGASALGRPCGGLFRVVYRQPHVERIDCSAHVVDADDRGASRNGGKRGGDASRHPLADVASREVPMWLCATGRQAPDTPLGQDGKARSSSRLCVDRLAETETRIDDDAVARDARPPRRQRALDAGSRAPRARRRSYAGPACIVRGWPRMCIRHTAALLAATTSSAPGSCSARTSLTMAAPASIAARMTAGFIVSMLTQRTLAGKRCRRREDACELLGFGDRSRARTRRLAADVDDVGAIADQLPRVIERALRVEKAAPVGEGVGRDVERCPSPAGPKGPERAHRR